MPTFLTLPMPPSVNTLYRNVPGRGRVKTARYRTWEAAAKASFLAQRRGVTAVPGHFKAHLIFDDTKRRGDIDNRAKAIFDFLQPDVIADDALCDRLTLEWGTAGRGMCKVYLSETDEKGQV